LIKDGKRHKSCCGFSKLILQRSDLNRHHWSIGDWIVILKLTRTAGGTRRNLASSSEVNQEVILSAGAFDSPKLR